MCQKRQLCRKLKVFPQNHSDENLPVRKWLHSLWYAYALWNNMNICLIFLWVSSIRNPPEILLQKKVLWYKKVNWRRCQRKRCLALVSFSRRECRLFICSSLRVFNFLLNLLEIIGIANNHFSFSVTVMYCVLSNSKGKKIHDSLVSCCEGLFFRGKDFPPCNDPGIFGRQLRRSA